MKRGFALGLALWLTASSFATPPKKLVIVSWDGAPDYVLDRLLAEKQLPNVARLIRKGFRAESTIPAFPSKTAVCHFTLFSGTWPNLSNVTGNESPVMPRSEHTSLEGRSGFDAYTHATEPLWVTATKAGKKVLALSAAGSFPPEPDQQRLRDAKVSLDRYVEFSGFESQISPSTVVTLDPQNLTRNLTLGETKLEVTAERDNRINFSCVVIRSSDRVWRVRANTWSGAILLTKGLFKGNTFARVFQLDPETGKSLVFFRAANAIRGTESEAETARYAEAYGGFHDGPTDLYQAGQFGAPITLGGDGTAERRLIECIRKDLEFAKRSFRYGWNHWKPDLAFHYTPQTDNVGHLWMGVLDPEGPNYDSALASKIWPYYQEVWRLQDDWLGDMMKAAGHDAAFALVSDHGMAGVGKRFYVNEVLRAAGLCSFTAEGKIDLTRSKAFSPPWGDFCVIANTTDWKGGIVPPAEADAVLQQAKAALLTAKDTAVTRVFDRKEAEEVGGGGPAGGDLYLEFKPGYYPSGKPSDKLETWDPSPLGNGAHGFYPMRSTMRAIFVVGGDGVPVGRVGSIRQIDVVPTLCSIMGWPTPPLVQGKVVLPAVAPVR